MNLSRERGAAHQQRHADSGFAQIGRGDHHLLRAFHQQAAQADGVRLMMLEGADQIFRRHLDAEVDHVIAIVLQDDLDEVFADVVDIALHRGENHFAALGDVGLFHELLEMAHRGLHRFGRLQHFGDDQLVGVEKAADFGHSVHQRAIDDVQRLCAFRALAVEIFDQAVARAFDDVVRQALVERKLFLRFFLLFRGTKMFGDCGDVKLVDGGLLLARLRAPIFRSAAQKRGLRVLLRHLRGRVVEEQIFREPPLVLGNRSEALQRSVFTMARSSPAFVQ